MLPFEAGDLVPQALVLLLEGTDSGEVLFPEVQEQHDEGADRGVSDGVEVELRERLRHM